MSTSCGVCALTRLTLAQTLSGLANGGKTVVFAFLAHEVRDEAFGSRITIRARQEYSLRQASR